MEKKKISNDYGSRAGIRNEKLLDDMVNEIIESYLNRDPYDYGR